ncbi:hypothetical protein AGMMS49944_06660 [Spirochaetia bacterium]|nr:hypothetical protein AGMMS49944_06660 [Spirochaetia bacterium]
MDISEAISLLEDMKQSLMEQYEYDIEMLPQGIYQKNNKRGYYTE